LKDGPDKLRALLLELVRAGEVVEVAVTRVVVADAASGASRDSQGLSGRARSGVVDLDASAAPCVCLRLVSYETIVASRAYGVEGGAGCRDVGCTDC
jgi:hypothetical protein